MSTTKDTGVTVDAANVINDILPCCAQGVAGRDLLAQAEYAADVQRTIGHQPGIARQELANKQARQVSHMSAGLAQFLARRYAGGVKDDGDLDKVEVALVSVIMGLLESKLPGIATEEANGICHPDGVTIKIDETGQLSALRYELGEFYLFRHPTLKHGMQSCYGGLLTWPLRIRRYGLICRPRKVNCFVKQNRSGRNYRPIYIISWRMEPTLGSMALVVCLIMCKI